jgi:hypothetical protein
MVPIYGSGRGVMGLAWDRIKSMEGMVSCCHAYDQVRDISCGDYELGIVVYPVNWIAFQNRALRSRPALGPR